MNLATLNANVNLDISDFEAGVKTVKSQMNSVKEGFDDAEKAANDSIDVFAVALGGVVAGFTEAFIEGFADIVWEVSKDGVVMASRLSEVQNVIDTTFGTSASRVDSWARRTKQSFGIGELAAKDYASTLGAAFSTGDLSDSQIFEISTALVGLSGDLASFYNISQDDAFQKIFSGMTGEMEPLKSLGIVMSDAALEAHAMEQGFLAADQKWAEFKKNADDMTLLRYSFLMKQTANAQGDFAKTSDGYANQMRLLEENIDELKIAVGQSLLPVLTELVGWFNGLFGGSENASEGIDTLKESAKDTFWSIESTTSNALALVEALERLSESGDEAANADTWNAVLEQLKRTIPGIGDLIDAETGKIEGGTEALKEYIESWRMFSLEQAKQKAIQGMYDEYAAIALEIVQLQNDQYIADTLEANAQKEQDRIVIELAKQAFAQQQETVGVTDGSFGEWQRIAEAYLQTGNKYHLEAGNELTGGMSLDDLGGEYVAEAFDEFRRWMEEEKEYAKTDNAADIADRQALLDRKETEIETLSALYTQALEQASKSEQTVIVQTVIDGEVVAESVAPYISDKQVRETQTKTKTN